MTARAEALYGRNRDVSKQFLVLAAGLCALLAATFYTDVNTLWPAPLAPSGAVLVVGLAAVESYYNEGLLVAWILAFAATLPAFVFHPSRGPVFAVTPATAPAAVAKAGGVAVVLGTAGFVIGAALRRRRDRRRGDRYVPSAAVLPAAVVGRERRTAARALLVAAGEFAALFAATRIGVLPVGLGLGGVAGIAALLALMAAPAALYAARNGGLLVCWALAFAPLFGVFLALQFGFVGEPAPDRPVLYALGSAALFALPVGTGAFLLGWSARWARNRLATPTPNASPK